MNKCQEIVFNTKSALAKIFLSSIIILEVIMTTFVESQISKEMVKYHCPRYEEFPDIGLYMEQVIEILNEQNQPIVFMLWGNHAKSFLPMLTNPNHLVLQATHPSPFSAYNGFFGCKHFSKCNQFLTSHGVSPINWQI